MVKEKPRQFPGGVFLLDRNFHVQVAGRGEILLGLRLDLVEVALDRGFHRTLERLLRLVRVFLPKRAHCDRFHRHVEFGLARAASRADTERSVLCGLDVLPSQYVPFRVLSLTCGCVANALANAKINVFQSREEMIFATGTL